MPKGSRYRHVDLDQVAAAVEEHLYRVKNVGGTIEMESLDEDGDPLVMYEPIELIKMARQWEVQGLLRALPSDRQMFARVNTYMSLHGSSIQDAGVRCTLPNSWKAHLQQQEIDKAGRSRENGSKGGRPKDK